MSADDYVLVQGMRATRGTLARWQERPWPVLGRWAALSLAIAACLLVAVLAVAELVTPDSTPVYVPGVDYSPDAGDMGRILLANGLVLALHAMACVAGFIAGSSMRIEAERRTGLSRQIHIKAGAIAIVWVGLVTAFSLVSQAYILGSIAADVADGYGISPGVLVVTVLPHAVLELVALFLPLAAWMMASRRQNWHELLAATIVTVLLAIPVLVAAAFVEVYVSPGLLRSLAG